MPAAPPRCNASSLQRLNVTITNHQRTRAVESRLLRRIVKSLLAEMQMQHADVAIHLVSASEMTRLNEAFVKHVGSTDVITFDYSVHATRPASPAAPLHGEIFVCLDEAVVQARRFHTTWQSELARYCVHGVLHLLGYDDLKPAARRRMKRAEDGWLRNLAHHFPLTRLARGRGAS